jgi:hypothetical protein
MSRLDDALIALHRHAPEYGGGMTDHGPMVVEALSAVGRDDAIPAWLERYEPRLDPAPADGTPPRDDSWREALGRLERYPDLAALVAREIDADGWRATLRRWAPRLAPGLVGAAAHGVIRAGHAVRGLVGADTAPRRRELAQALAYWAATYYALPTGAGRPAGTPSRVLPTLPRMPRALRGDDVFITTAIERLHGYPPFASVIAVVDADGDPGPFLSDLSKAAARAFLANAGSGMLPLIAMVHTVTATAAAREIAAQLDPAVQRDVVRYAWQAAASLYMALGEAEPVSAEEAHEKARHSPGFEALLDRALGCGDEHAIKLVEACAREHALVADDAYVAAALEGVERFESASPTR